MDIKEFLLARVAEDEDEAARMGCAEYYDDGWSLEHEVHIRKECAAKRAIVGYFEMLCEQGEQADVFGYHATGLLIAIRKLAAVYSDHPDYRQEWSL